MVAFGARAACAHGRTAGVPAVSSNSRSPVGRLATALAVVLSGVLAPELLRLGPLRQDSGVAIAAPAPLQGATQERAGSPLQKKKCRIALRSKLSKVPVFVVTNDAQSPFLSQIQGGDQAALLFLFPAEAQKMLQVSSRTPVGVRLGDEGGQGQSPPSPTHKS